MNFTEGDHYPLPYAKQNEAQKPKDKKDTFCFIFQHILRTAATQNP